MKGYACVQGERRKVLTIGKDKWWCKFIAASNLDYEAICGIAGSVHNVDVVLKKNAARVVPINFEFDDQLRIKPQNDRPHHRPTRNDSPVRRRVFLAPPKQDDTTSMEDRYVKYHVPKR